MKDKKLWKMPRAKEVENKLGVNTKNRPAIIASLRSTMKTLRAVLKRNAEVFYSAHPKERRTCDTCAFSVQTRRRGGFLATSYGVMWSIKNRKPFVCHANQPGHSKNEIDPSKLMICMGFALVADDPVAKEAAELTNRMMLAQGIRERSKRSDDEA